MLFNVYATVREPSRPAFPHELRGHRDLTDPGLAPHLQGFMGFVMANGERPMTAMRYHVLRHLQRVQHHFALEVEAVDVPAFRKWALDVNGIVFTTDSEVRAPDGRVLVSARTGEPEPGADVPYPEDARRRKASTQAFLAARGLRVPESLPPSISEHEVELRAPADVVRRVYALFACALRAESIATKRAIPVDDLKQRLPLAFESLSPAEAAFMGGQAPEGATASFGWRYEALAVLVWALGLAEIRGTNGAPAEGGALPFPDTIVDVSGLAGALLPLDAKRALAEARLRSTDELLSALDLAYRLHWITTDARVNPNAPETSLVPGVVLERHYALSWLVRFENADWDDVDTPT